MVDRVEVFVDTSYLLASFYNSWTTGARAQLEIDLPAVTSHLNTIVSDKIHLPVHRQLWYDGIPDSGPHRYQRTLRHIDGVQLRAGQLIEWGDRRTQKGVDTRLVADMVLRSVRGIVSDIVLVSGDADMIPGVETAVEHGVRVHLIGFGWDSISNSLRSACDTVTVLDPRDDFEECMHIEVLESFTHHEDAGDGTGVAPADADTAAGTEAGTAAGTEGGASSVTAEDDADSESADEVDDGVTDTFGTAPDIPHGVPLIPPVLSPGKCGRRTTRHRIRTHHATADSTAHDAEVEANAATCQEKDTAPASQERAGEAARVAAAQGVPDAVVEAQVVAAAVSASETAGEGPGGTAGGAAPTPGASAGTPGSAQAAAEEDERADRSTAEAAAQAAATQAAEDHADSAAAAPGTANSGALATAAQAADAASAHTDTPDSTAQPDAAPDTPAGDAEPASQPTRRPSPGMMAQKRRPIQRSRYVPLPYDEVWESAGNQTPFDIGQQYAMWWYNNAATAEQRSTAHILTGGGLPAEIDRPLLQFACQTLDAYTLSDSQRVNLRDGFHMGIRGIIMGK